MFFTWKFSRWTPDRGGVRSFGQRLVTGTQLGELEDDLVGMVQEPGDFGEYFE